MTIRRFLFFSAPSCLFLLLFFPRNLSYNSLCQKKTNPPKLHEFKRSGLLAWIKEREREKERGKKSSSKASTLSSSAGFFDRDKTLSPRLEGSAHNHLLPSFWIPFFAFGNVFKVRLN